MENEEDIRSVTFLNETGDVTLGWTYHNDEVMLKIIQKKMNEGMTFFIIDKKFFNLIKTKTKLTKPYDAFKNRSIIMDDDDFKEHFDNGTLRLYKKTSTEIVTLGVAKDAQEVVKNHSVGITQRRGG